MSHELAKARPKRGQGARKVATVFAAIVAASPAGAGDIAFVSQTGNNVGDCSSAAAPCRSFNYARTQVNAGGEIKALTPGVYAPVTLTKSVTITGVEGAGILSIAAGAAITISAGPNDVVNIVGLTLDGQNGLGTRGIDFTSGGLLNVKNCDIRSFNNFGILFAPSGASKFVIEDTHITKIRANTSAGIRVSPGAAGSATGVVSRVASTENVNGLLVLIRGKVGVFDSVFSGNTQNGILLGDGSTAGGEARVTRSTITNNAGGFNNVSGVAETSGKNFIRGNGTNLNGTVTNVGTF